MLESLHDRLVTVLIFTPRHQQRVGSCRLVQVYEVTNDQVCQLERDRGEVGDLWLPVAVVRARKRTEKTPDGGPEA